MSKIGKQPINIPANVEVNIGKDNSISIKGPKGELKQHVNRDIILEYKNNVLTLKRPTDSIRHKSFHGLYRSLIQNMVTGVTEEFEMKLLLIGVGYRVSHEGQLLDISAGYSHNIIFEVPKEIKVNTITKKGIPPTIILQSIDKQILGEVAAKIRSIRKPEPYQGKGIRYANEIVRKKAGKSAASGSK